MRGITLAGAAIGLACVMSVTPAEQIVLDLKQEIRESGRWSQSAELTELNGPKGSVTVLVIDRERKEACVIGIMPNSPDKRRRFQCIQGSGTLDIL